MNDVTRLLAAIDQGDGAAAERLLPLVYDELRRLAAQKLSHEKPGQTLQPTALVHEAWLRLIEGDSRGRWEGRRHFFLAAAESMRRILIDNARRRRSLKRGGDLARADLDEFDVAAPEAADDLLALDEALARLTRESPDAAELVHLRYFAGLTIPQAAETLGVSPRSADRLWAYARAWLLRALREE